MIIYPDFAETIAEMCRSLDKIDPEEERPNDHLRPYVAFVQLHFEGEPCGRLLNDGVGWHYDPEAK